MYILLVGLNHKTAPVEVRERLAFHSEASSDALNRLKRRYQNGEFVLLSTCNRVELFALTSGSDSIPGLLHWWRANLKGRGDEFDEALEVNVSRDALLHLLRLSAGLESMVVGEDQILGQLQKSCAEAKDCAAAGPILEGDRPDIRLVPFVHYLRDDDDRVLV